MPMPVPTDRIAGASGEPAPATLHAAGRHRRRLIGAAAGGAGILLAVQARSVLGASPCLTTSALASGNQSAQPDALPCDGGASPTVWKEQLSLLSWSAAIATAPELKPAPLVEDCAIQPAKELEVTPTSVIKKAGTLVSDVLPGAGLPRGTGLWEFLAFPQSDSRTELMRHLIAAWLNAGFFPNYPIKRTEVAAMWAALKSGSGRYCPASIVCTDSMGMTADDVIAYISSMYDKTSELAFLRKVK